MISRIAIINGPNLNMLGVREPEKYGSTSLAQLEHQWKEFGQKHNIEITTFQSNHEGEIVDFIQSLYLKCDYIVINAGAFTHYSIAIRDALLAVATPFFEVHISNIHAREKFRHRSFLSDIAKGVVVGLGTYGYLATLHAILDSKL